MKILEVNKFLYIRRGAERHFFDVIELLRKRGHTVEVFGMRHKENAHFLFEKYFPAYVGYNASDSTFLERLFGVGRIFWSCAARRGIKKLLSEWQPEVAHIHNAYHQLSLSIFGPLKQRGIPIIMTVHDYHLVSPDKDAYYPKVGKRYWKFLFIKKYGILKRLLLVLKKYWEDFLGVYQKQIDYYIAPSMYVKNVLGEAGLPAEKIGVLPHFLCHSEKETEFGNEVYPKQPFFLYAGSLSLEKGVDDLIKIAEALDIDLVLAGEAENGFVPKIHPRVLCIGKKTRSELFEWMQRSSCVVSASKLPETFGLIALEAVVLGKPFFGLNTGAYPEIVHNGQNGYLTETTGELQEKVSEFFQGKLSFDAEKIKRDASERFGEEKYVQAFEALLHKVITRH